MFKNALIYRIVHWNPPSLSDLEGRLAANRFVDCGATQRESSGWVEPRGERHGALAEAIAGQLVLKHCSETRVVPAAVVKNLAAERLDAIERQTGRRPKGRPVREIREQIVHELMPRAFPKRATTWVWVDPNGRWLVVDSASAKRADAIVTRLMAVLDGDIALAPLQTAISPATAMAAWLQDQQAPRGFTIDRECELRQPGAEKASVRYARHALEIDEVSAHIRQGKVPTRLALTWAGRVSFVLTEALALKRIALLDGVAEGSRAGARDGDFDADVSIATGELRRLVPDLVEALGAELGPPPVPAVAGTPPRRATQARTAVAERASL
jgi:recombination associated protein RdgC